MSSIEVTVLLVALLITLLALKLQLYLTLAIVLVVAALFYGGAGFLAHVVYSTAAKSATWSLALSVLAISWLVSVYAKTHVIGRLSEGLSRAIKNSVATITLVPGIIGLLPIPGGALMSAPIVDSIGSRVGLPTAKKLFVNVWYRHVILYVYPLSSIIIVASAVTGVGLWELIAKQVPVAIAMFIMGLPLTGLRNVEVKEKADIASLIKDFSPILIAVALAFILTPIDEVLNVERLSVAMAAFIAVLAFKVIHGAGCGVLAGALKDRKIWEIVLISFEVMALRELFLSMDLRALASGLSSLGVGLTMPVVLPIFFSLISGSPTAGIAIASPMVASMVGMDVRVASLIYASAFLSYVASPLHLCNAYTAQYYGTSMAEGYKYLVPTTAASLLLAIALAVL